MEFELKPEKLLQGEVAIITGAAHGIGQGIALEMAREGAKVVIADINQENAKVTIQKLEQLEVDYLFQKTDISNEEDHKNLIKQTLKKFGRIDILVNNAAIGSGKTFRKIDTEELQRVVATNLTGTFLLTKAVAQEMIKSKKGKILFITSIHDHIPYRRPDYSGTKAAQAMMVKEFAQDLSPYGIRVNGIAPGAIDTDDQHVESGSPIRLPHIPLGQKAGLPKDIARMAIVLTSEYWSRYATGTIVNVDGGLGDVNWLTFEIPLDKPLKLPRPQK